MYVFGLSPIWEKKWVKPKMGRDMGKALEMGFEVFAQIMSLSLKMGLAIASLLSWGGVRGGNVVVRFGFCTYCLDLGEDGPTIS